MIASQTGGTCADKQAGSGGFDAHGQPGEGAEWERRMGPRLISLWLVCNVMVQYLTKRAMQKTKERARNQSEPAARITTWGNRLARGRRPCYRPGITARLVAQKRWNCRQWAADCVTLSLTTCPPGWSHFPASWTPAGGGSVGNSWQRDQGQGERVPLCRYSFGRAHSQGLCMGSQRDGWKRSGNMRPMKAQT